MDSFYGKIPGYQEILEKTDQLKENGVYHFSVGKTVFGREIPAFAFGQRRGATLYAGGFHSQEALTVLLLFRLAEDLAGALEAGRSLARIECEANLERQGVIIVPCVNVDGLELVTGGFATAGVYEDSVRIISGGDLQGWNANLHGVDLNHNFDAGFQELKRQERAAGIYGPSPRQYGGERPFSEPETLALCHLCKRYRVQRVMAFHSQGEEIYYKYGKNTPPEAYMLAKILASSSRYTLKEPTGMASHGGFKDWFIEKWCRPGFTIEIGRGVNPLPISDFEPIYNRLLEMMILGIVI